MNTSRSLTVISTSLIGQGDTVRFDLVELAQRHSTVATTRVDGFESAGPLSITHVTPHELSDERVV